MKIVSYFFDFLFPPRPHQELLRETGELSYQPNQRFGTNYLGLFSDPSMKAAIVENKYYKNDTATNLLKHLVNLWVEDLPKPLVLVPIPLSKERMRSRGYNQVVRVLEKMTPSEFVICHALKRVKNTKPQTDLNKSERRKNLKDAFAVEDVKSIESLKNATIVIVDDVITTGATMEAARATLTPHIPPSCQLKTLAIAH